MKRVLLPGKPYPLGASVERNGVNFAVFSEHSTAAFVCLFDGEGHQTEAIELKERTQYIWHGLVRGIGAGQLYGFRIDGPWEPEKGSRFNSAKLLVDPYAKAIAGEVDWKAPIFGFKHDTGNDLEKDDQDSADGMPKCVVVGPETEWNDDRRPDTPLVDSVIYEVHVKGFSKLNPDVPEGLRGTYAGMAHEASIDYFKRLGVTAVELLPVHHFIDEGHLVDKGLRNYWGYNTLGYFTPSARYSSCGDCGGQVTEFRQMVKALHAAGIEVILDVVYNHTCEGNQLGPMLSLKGIDNVAYYRLAEDPRYYVDYTGTGNTLNANHPQVLKLIMDSLRYWILDMHVDGFRFDLASTLARELHDVDRLSGFFDIIHQDPTISSVKLIAEPWDVGEGGYQVGNFPVLWAEWNGKYRDTVRRFWKGDSGQLGDLAYRLSGSSDLYRHNGRTPYASINFVTAHDGFTMWDLVSYDQKHNEANLDDNKDGTDDNNSWNSGVEGETDDPEINHLREQRVRSFLVTLLLSQGVPMIAGGDEFARTQKGNNNGYCQDNELSWFDWKLGDREERLLEFTRRLVKLRLDHPNLHRQKFFQDLDVKDPAMSDLVWYGTDGKPMPQEAWGHEWAQSLAFVLNGNTLRAVDEDGNTLVDDSFLFLVNASHHGVEFELPPSPLESAWNKVIDTANFEAVERGSVGGPRVIVEGRSMMVFSDGKS